MKRLVTLVAVLLLSFSFVLPASAVKSNHLYIESTNADNNRLVTLNVSAKSNCSFSAGTFDISFSGQYLDFRKVEPASSADTVSCNCTQNKVKMIFLSKYGRNIKKGDTLFSITFKTVQSGTGTVQITSSDCVNNKAKSVSSLIGTLSKVSINGTSVKVSTKSVKGSTANSKSSSKSSSSSSDRSGGSYYYSNGNDNNPNALPQTNPFEINPMIIIGGITLLVLLGGVIVAVVRKLKNTDTSEKVVTDKTDDISNDENQ